MREDSFTTIILFALIKEGDREERKERGRQGRRKRKSCSTHPAHLDQVVDHAVVAHFRNTRGAAPGLDEENEGGRKTGREGGDM